jgi:hydroxymethylpyrimidine/phosphomethylpyrimidine kinase
MAGRAPTVLAVAGSDSSGGAGLAADLLAAEALGARLRWAVTAVTAQTDQAVGAVHTLPPALVCRQIEMALGDGAVASAKLGMLGNAACAHAVAEALRDFAVRRPVVIDPVLLSSSGATLIDAAGVAVLIEELLPMAALVTPNRPELEHLARCLGASPADTVAQQAAFLMRAGARAVLVKGGHAGGPEATDLLFERHRSEPAGFSSPRVDARMRGTGCRLATAIAVRLARGEGLAASCASAKAYLHSLLAAVAAQRGTA